MRTSFFSSAFRRFRVRLQSLSFRTGVVVLALCVPFYVLSFAQMALPSAWLGAAAKGVLWAVFFGMAKAFQYGGLLILGADGVKRLRQWKKHPRV